MTLATRLGLWSAAAVPVVYFGTQAVASLFYPGYSFLSMSASELGSDHSRFPLALNAGAIATGIAALLAAWGLSRGLERAGAHAFWAAATGLAVASLGGAAIWAGLHPLPSPKHNPGFLGAGTFLIPFVGLAAVWSLTSARVLKRYLVVNLLGFGVVALLMGGVIAVDRTKYSGLLQRLAAIVMYLPVGALGIHLLRRDGRSAASLRDDRVV